MTAYDPSQWSDLFVATAGASAALASLVFVALIPGQGHVALGAELLAISLVLGTVIARLPTTYTASAEQPRAWLWGRWSVRVAGTLPFLIGGVSVLAESGGGIYWIVAGIVFAITGAVINAWVLLVEILR